MTGSNDALRYRAFADPDAAEAWLAALAGVPDDSIDLTGACLALGALERPWQKLGREVDHLARLAEDLRGAAPGPEPPLPAPTGAGDVGVDRHGSVREKRAFLPDRTAPVSLPPPVSRASEAGSGAPGGLR